MKRKPPCIVCGKFPDEHSDIDHDKCLEEWLNG